MRSDDGVWEWGVWGQLKPNTTGSPLWTDGRSTENQLKDAWLSRTSGSLIFMNFIAATGKGGALLAHTVRPNYHRILVRLLSYDPLQQAMRISKF